MQKRQTQEYPAEKARQGEIILRGPGLRLVFIAGLVGAVVLAVVLGWLAR
ncbi:MAG: peptide ABC transporter permease [Methylobacteriaceae bacterium]|nr:peptide ABC transporter permease [Methylobacteriaceae bacterium]